MSARVLAARALITALNNDLATLRANMALYEQQLNLVWDVRNTRGISQNSLDQADEREIWVGNALLALDARIEAKERGKFYYMNNRIERMSADE